MYKQKKAVKLSGYQGLCWQGLCCKDKTVEL